jgi:hypothetical protein
MIGHTGPLTGEFMSTYRYLPWFIEQESKTSLGYLFYKWPNIGHDFQ